MLNRDLRKVIVIDKDAKAFSPTPTNGVTVQPFEFKEQGDLGDEQLLQVADFVKCACGARRRRRRRAPDAAAVAAAAAAAAAAQTCSASRRRTCGR